MLLYGLPILAILLLLPKGQVTGLTGFLAAIKSVFTVYGGHFAANGTPVLTGAGKALGYVMAVAFVLALLTSGTTWIMGADRALTWSHQASSVRAPSSVPELQLPDRTDGKEGTYRLIAPNRLPTDRNTFGGLRRPHIGAKREAMGSQVQFRGTYPLPRSSTRRAVRLCLPLGWRTLHAGNDLSQSAFQRARRWTR